MYSHLASHHQHHQTSSPSSASFPPPPPPQDSNSVPPHLQHQHQSSVYYGPSHDAYIAGYGGDSWTQFGAEYGGGGWAGAGAAGGGDWHQQAVMDHRMQAQLGVGDWDYNQGHSMQHSHLVPGQHVITPPPAAHTFGDSIPPASHKRAASPDVPHAGLSDADLGLANKKKRMQHPLPPAPEGQVITDKSCARCRIRKVKCDRRYPVCTNCKDRKEECDLHMLHPDKKLKIEERGRLDAERIRSLEHKLAQLQRQIKTPAGSPGPTGSSATADFPPTASSEATTLVEIGPPSPPSSVSKVGYTSLDWRLATPQMAKSLSQHLVDAFYSSCCFLMPSFQYFRTHLAQFADANGPLPRAGQAAISAFVVIGARASPHSALLGLPARGTVAGAQPTVDALSAGARRQSACLTLFQQAHQLGFDSEIAEDSTAENLATVLALYQMSHFNELGGKKSRALVRAAVAHFKELQDAAYGEGDGRDEALGLRRMFGLAVYTADAIEAAYSRRASLLSRQDLEQYFSDVGIVMPNLPEDDLRVVLRTLAGTGQPEVARFQMANHLSCCWTAAAQRMFAQLAAPSSARRTAEQLHEGMVKLWRAIDSTREALLELQQSMRDHEAADPNHQHHHNHSHNGTAHAHHNHDQDYSLQSIRTDRDLLDLNALAFDLLKKANRPELAGLVREAESRVRRDLKRNAFYFNVYANGSPDEHMVFHHVSQLEHNPDWVRMALQRVGEPGGPASADEELTEEELDWMAEGLERACFYTPLAEKRLRELRPERVAKVEELGEGESPLGSGAAVAQSLQQNLEGAGLLYAGQQAAGLGSVEMPKAGYGLEAGFEGYGARQPDGLQYETLLDGSWGDF